MGTQSNEKPSLDQLEVLEVYDARLSNALRLKGRHASTTGLQDIISEPMSVNSGRASHRVWI